MAGDEDFEPPPPSDRLIRRELLPALGTVPIAESRRRNLIGVVNAIADRGRLAATHKVREVSKRITGWADDEELIDNNPFLGGTSPLRLREPRAHCHEARLRRCGASGR